MASADAGVIEPLVALAVGQELWSAVVGPPGDYVLSLEIGARQRRSMRLANPRLSFLKRTFEGEFGFLIECPWRVDAPDHVITSCLDYLGRKEVRPGQEVGEITDRTIEAIELTPPAWDLTLRLSGGYVLRCLAAEADIRGKRNNWSFWSPDGPLTVGPVGKLRERVETHVNPVFRRLYALEESDDSEPPPDGS